MSYTYEWLDAEKTALKRTCSEGGPCAGIPADPGNRDYAEFLSSGATAADYVAPPAPPEPTLEEKLAAAGIKPDELIQLLEQASGVTVAELKAAASR